MDELELKDLIEKVQKYLMVSWAVLFFFSLLHLLHPIAGNYFTFLKIPVNAQAIHSLKDVMFILFALIIISIFFVKRSWLSPNTIFKMIESRADFKKTWGIPVTPFVGELYFGNGVFYHLRKTFLLVYVLLLSALVLSDIYFTVTGDRSNIFMYAIIIIFSAILNFPRKRFFSKLELILQEDTNND